jgi:hypothetical protein
MRSLSTIENGFSMFQLDLERVPKLCGKETLRRFDELYAIMSHTRYPLFFRGPASTGKTTVALNLVAKYAREREKPAYFVQISPEQTKSTLIIGKRLVSGTLKTVKGCVAQAAEQGAPIVVDECSQGTPEILANMQQLLERTAVITDGDQIVYADPEFRIIFCANPPKTHAANVPLPTAFASRLLAFNFDYPSFEEDVDITREIVSDRSFNDLPVKVPDCVMRYVVSLMRERRSEAYPLGARNSAMCIALLNILEHVGNGDNGRSRVKVSLEERFRRELGLSTEQNLEARLTTIYTRIHAKQPDSTVVLIEDPDVKDFIEFVCKLGVARFTEAVKSSFMVNVDFDSFALDVDQVKQAIVNSIL